MGILNKVMKTNICLFPTDERKDTFKKYETLWIKIILRNLLDQIIRSETNNLDDYDEKYVKIKFNLDDDLPLKKKLELDNMIIVVRFVFHEDSIYYPHVFLDKNLYKS